MVRRRVRIESRDDVMPLALLEPGARVARRAWFYDRQLYVWADQHAAIQRAREAYGIEVPDPRELFRGLGNDSPAIKRGRPRRVT